MNWFIFQTTLVLLMSQNVRRYFLFTGVNITEVLQLVGLGTRQDDQLPPNPRLRKGFSSEARAMFSARGWVRGATPTGRVLTLTT